MVKQIKSSFRIILEGLKQEVRAVEGSSPFLSSITLIYWNSYTSQTQIKKVPEFDMSFPYLMEIEWLHQLFQSFINITDVFIQNVKFF